MYQRHHPLSSHTRHHQPPLPQHLEPHTPPPICRPRYTRTRSPYHHTTLQHREGPHGPQNNERATEIASNHHTPSPLGPTSLAGPNNERTTHVIHKTPPPSQTKTPTLYANRDYALTSENNRPTPLSPLLQQHPHIHTLITSHITYTTNLLNPSTQQMPTLAL